MNKLGLIALIVLLSGCSLQPDKTPDRWFKAQNLPSQPQRSEMVLCTQFGCESTATTKITDQEWLQVKQLFTETPPSSAKDERLVIAQAIGAFEQIMGAKVNTHDDKAENDFGLNANSRQLDCVAETSNTTTYLLLLQNNDLLHYHHVVGNAHRGLNTLNLPHNSAVIEQTDSGARYTVDSWYRDNGEEAWITELNHWLSGASPR